MNSTPLPVPGDPMQNAAVRASEQVVDTKSLPAADRLAASRTLMRATMLDYVHPPKRVRSAPRSSASPPSMMDGLGDKVLDGLKGLPGLTIVLDSVQSWWAQHPVRTVTVVGGEVANTFVRPVARRNPLGLMLGAVVVGALLVASRPWRWLLRPALFIGIVPQLASHLVRRLPLQSWLTMLTAAMGQKKAASASRRADVEAMSTAKMPQTVPPRHP